MNKSLIVAAAILIFLSKYNITYSQSLNLLPEYKEVMFLRNIYSNGDNPVSLSFSPIRDYLSISLKGGNSKGEFHAVDKADKVNSLEFDISGMKQISSVNCYGGIKYINQKQFNQRWNSTLFIDERNPFILGDSVYSDFNTEVFNLQGGVSFNPFSRVFLALNLEYLVGSTANQTDPRPRTDGMHFKINPGILYKASDYISLGISGFYELRSESITHTLINSQIAYSYFRFTGMGNYSGVGTGKLQSYPRNYKGDSKKGAFQLILNNDKTVSNYTEISYLMLSEDARDGGQTFTFMGGDYRKRSIKIHNRFSLNLEKWMHNITINYETLNNEGDWYEQTEFLDPDKNNQLSYKIHQKNLIHKDKEQIVNLAYQINYLKNNLPYTTVLFDATLKNKNLQHFEGDGYYQKYSNIYLSLSGKQSFLIKERSYFSLFMGVNYRYSLSDSMNAREKLKESYTALNYEYLTGDYYGANASLTYQHKFKNYWLGIFVKGSSIWQEGVTKYASSLKGTSRKYYEAGISLTL